MKILIVGAKGRFGRHAVQAALDRGHEVIAFARHWESSPKQEALTYASGDARQAEDLVRAGQGADCLVDALNPPYGTWTQTLPPLTQAVIAATRTLGTHLLVAGNIYAYGSAMPARLTRETPKAPDTAMARARLRADQAYADSGLPVILLRGGDFLEGAKTGNWFDSHMMPPVAKGAFLYPGPRDVPHAFAYLPDMAQALIALGESAATQAAAGFREVLFPGFALTGAQMQAQVEQVVGKRLRPKGVPWAVIRFMGLFSAQMRGVAAMSYLWRQPHAIEETVFDELLPNFVPTSIENAFAKMVPKLM